MSNETQPLPYNQHSVQEYGLVVHPDLARFFTDFEDVLDSLRLSWEGKDIDYSCQPPKLVDFGDPLMNRKGVGKFIMFLKASCHKGIPVANFDQTRPYVFGRSLGMKVAEHIFVHGFTDYDIKSVEDANTIIFPIVKTLFAVDSRPVAEGERKFIKGYTKESHIHGPEKKRGFSI